jgi:hypothetical protein
MGFFRRKLTPLFPWVREMRMKDPVLFDEIRSLPVQTGMARWREVYPEDFAELQAPEK